MGTTGIFERPILTTGDAGLIDPHLTDALPACDYCVHTLGNLSTGKCDNLSLDDKRAELLEGDAADATILAVVLKDYAVAAHLAAVVLVQASVDGPVATHQSSFITTPDLCGAMREWGVRRVVFASDAAVCGQSGEGTVIDEDTPKSPLMPYTSDKLASEYYLDFYRRQHGLEPVIFRFFNAYRLCQDPSSSYSGVIDIFTEHVLKGVPIIVFGDGEQTHDFIYVAGLIDLLVQALGVTVAEPEAVNVGLNHGIGLKQLLAEIGQVLGGLPPMIHADARTGDIRHSRANNERLLRRFRFGQLTPMDVDLACLLDR